MKSTRLVPIALVSILGCSEAMDPLYRSQSAPAFGEFIIPIDSITVTPDPARQGDTLSIRLFHSLPTGDCTPWTIVKQNAGYRVEFTVWGRRQVMPPPCHPLPGQPVKIALNLPGGHEVFTIVVNQPGRAPLQREVIIRGAR